MRIKPAQRIDGQLRLPGDKSVSHRAAIISARARGRTRITNFSTSEDCSATLHCLRRLGVSIERQENTVSVEGAGIDGLRATTEALDCGNSGSTMRLLAGALAGQNFASTLVGDDSLSQRPMRRIIEPLEQMGARIEAKNMRAPLRITGRAPLAPILYEMPVASAQVKSCVLLAGLNAEGRAGVIESNAATRDHTERMLRWFGVEVLTESAARGDAQTQTIITLEGLSQPQARDVLVPGDISSAAFFIVAASLLPNSTLRLEGVGLNPTRARILETLRALGANVYVADAREQCNEEVGDIEIKGTARALAPLSGKAGANILRGAVIAQLIDELPILAVLGTQVEGGLEILDAAELRVKETDRIRACVENLRRMGANVEEREDGLKINGPAQLRGARLESYGDHRIAMAFAVAALTASEESEISGAECVGVSFPEFFALLDSVVVR
jgi:3-phosphoshikimate 1-carboxyvinyltransferase